MSDIRKDFADIEQLTVGVSKQKSASIVAPASSTLDANAAGVISYSVGSGSKVVLLPPEATTIGQERRFYAAGSSTGKLVLKNTSGDTILTISQGGNGRVANVKGVWKGSTGTSAAGAFVSALSADIIGAGSGFGFANSAAGTQAVALINAMRVILINAGLMAAS